MARLALDLASRIPRPRASILATWTVLTLGFTSLPAHAQNLILDNVVVVDGSNQPFTPQAGDTFYLRAEFSYVDPPPVPFCDFRLSRIVNGFQSVQPLLDWGCGYTGTTQWFQFWGYWILHEPGTYDITTIVDVNDEVAEVDETDNSLTIQLTISGGPQQEWTLVGADEGRALLGDGTDVIVGTMDDAFDFNHPYFAGNDSQERPRLIAALQNTLGTDDSPINSEHATRVMGPVLARGANSGDMTGMAPDARYVTAEFLRRDSSTHALAHVVDAAGFLVEHGVHVINMSWTYWINTTTAAGESGEAEITNLLVDYLAYGEGITVVAALNQLETSDRPTPPGSSRNVITVGALETDLARAWADHDHGPTLDGRSKPDLLGNARLLSGTFNLWRVGFPMTPFNGATSGATPFVTGGVAQLLDYGMTNGESTDHKVMKAVLMASAVKALDSNGDPWSNAPGQPLDDEQGAGILNMVRAHAVYSGGQANAGDFRVPGYALDTVSGTVRGSDRGTGGAFVYDLGESHGDGEFSAVLAWDRHTLWNDVNTNGEIDQADSFTLDPNDVQDDLDLVLLGPGGEYAVSRSTVDNVEHIWVENLPAGEYQLVVERQNVANSGTGEEFALAVYSSANWSSPIFSDDFESGNTLAWN